MEFITIIIVCLRGSRHGKEGNYVVRELRFSRRYCSKGVSLNFLARGRNEKFSPTVLALELISRAKLTMIADHG